MPAILYTNSSQLASTVGTPAARPKPNRNRTIYNMHSSRNSHKIYPQSTRSRPVQPSMSPTAVSSSTTYSPSAASPTPSVLSPASSSISFFPPYASQSPLNSHPHPPTQSRSSSQSSIQSLSSVSSSTSTSSNRTSPYMSSPSKMSSSGSMSASSSAARRSTKGAEVTDAYRRRYASYLASTFNMSMDAALIEADYQLLPQMVGKDCGLSEAEVYRGD